MERCAVCDTIVTDEEGCVSVEVPMDGWMCDIEVFICNDCIKKIREKTWDDISNTVIIDGKAVEPGIYTCIWAGNQEWRVIQTESDIIPDENTCDMSALMEVLSLAIEGVLEQHKESKPMEL